MLQEGAERAHVGSGMDRLQVVVRRAVDPRGRQRVVLVAGVVEITAVGEGYYLVVRPVDDLRARVKQRRWYGHAHGRRARVWLRCACMVTHGRRVRVWSRCGAACAQTGGWGRRRVAERGRDGEGGTARERDGGEKGEMERVREGGGEGEGGRPSPFRSCRPAPAVPLLPTRAANKLGRSSGASHLRHRLAAV